MKKSKDKEQEFGLIVAVLQEELPPLLKSLFGWADGDHEPGECRTAYVTSAEILDKVQDFLPTSQLNTMIITRVMRQLGYRVVMHDGELRWQVETPRNDDFEL